MLTTGKPDCAATVVRLRQTFDTGRTLDLDWRRTQLRAMVEMLADNGDAIVEAVTDDLRRPPFETWLAEIVATVNEARYAVKNVGKWTRRRHRRLEWTQLPGRAWIEYEPYGTVLIVGPWNVPFQLSLTPAIGAIAAGNTLVVKPSELAPASSRLMAELAPRYLDPEAVAVVEGDGAVTQELIAQGLDRVLFTGGTAVGHKIMAAAADHLTPVTLELGGKSPVIIAEDADVRTAARRIAWIKLMNSGQICVAPDYVLVHGAVRDRFVEEIRSAIADFRAETPAGLPIVNERQFARLAGALAATVGDVVIGGGTDSERLEIEPTVVVQPDPAEPLMTDEIFGPILPVLAVESVEHAVEFVRRRPKPLAAYLFTASKETRDRVIRAVPAGGMVINQLLLQVATARMPFGGVGPSGMGAYHGRFGFEEFSHRKSVLAKPTRPDLTAMFYPPYADKRLRMLRRLV
ncbi:aldehyde dehydrogenase family protein [Mycolicibacterium sp. 050232]|uniref:aldehyde dehydrogenase family protein n=1 Tax=Mycolicibacterium sp. 050232 TaxID=3113982 RepID=UPI002E281BF4|nr:aldehyde dehydrogenase family protein [Mycolicibacterium sp. 050232]MED5812621.1 aldehyde dehydrogenase family protein [Mycolicibacterium sp. 050232]